MAYSFSKNSTKILITVDPLLQRIFKAAIINSPVDFGIVNPTGGFRTAQMQNSLFRQNTSTKWVTSADGYIKKSYHQTGKAVDIYAYVNGKANWSIRYYKLIASHIKNVALTQFNTVVEWGGDWSRSKKDWGHFQISNYPSDWDGTADVIVQDDKATTKQNKTTVTRRKKKIMTVMAIAIILAILIVIYLKK